MPGDQRDAVANATGDARVEARKTGKKEPRSFDLARKEQNLNSLETCLEHGKCFGLEVFGLA